MSIKAKNYKFFDTKNDEKGSNLKLLQVISVPESFLDRQSIPSYGKLATYRTSEGTFLGKISTKPFGESIICDKSVRVSSDSTADGLTLSILEETPGIYDTLEVEVFIDCANFSEKLLDGELERIVREFLSLFIFGRGSEIKLNRLGNFGLKRLVVTDCKEGFGSASENTKITIKKVKPWNIHQPVALFGLESIRETIAGSIETNSKCKRFLVIGPSGTGKSTLARNLAVELSLPFFEVTSNDVIRAYPGDTEKALREVFMKASKFRKIAPSLILIKNLENFCPKDFDSKDSSHVSRISHQLMRLLEDVDAFVIATTSNIEILDPNVRRPGRIDEEFYLKMPEVQERRKILEKFLQKEDAVEYLVHRTNGFTGSDLALLASNILRNDFLNIESCLRKIQPTVLKGEIKIQKKSFDDLGGMESLKKAIELAVLGPLKRPEIFERFNLRPPRGILLYGPPGCAKTTIAQCIATATNMNFICTSAAEVYSPYVGKAEKFIVKLFNQGRLSAPSIIFLDEIDALVGRRAGAGGSNDVQTRILSALLTEMDGITGGGSILVVAATNRPDMIDDALMRPGRFDKLIHVPAPEATERMKIMKMLAKKFPFDIDVDVMEIVRRTECFSGADLVNLCNEAALTAATESLSAEKITINHFNQVLKDLRPSLTVDQIQKYKNYEKLHRNQ